MTSYKQEYNESPFESAVTSLLRSKLQPHPGGKGHHGCAIHLVVDNARTPSNELIDRVLDFEDGYGDHIDDDSASKKNTTTAKMVDQALSIIEQRKDDDYYLKGDRIPPLRNERNHETKTTKAKLCVSPTTQNHKDARWEASPTCQLPSPVRRLSKEYTVKGVSFPPLDQTMHDRTTTTTTTTPVSR